jgi:broad specificity phosphatase PhoE
VSATRIILIRHGETARNAGRLALGRADVPLNDLGLAQADALARRLGSDAFGRIDAIYSSPLQRAVQTAAPLARALGLDVQIEPGLIEMNVGEVEGLPYNEVREQYPEFTRAWFSEELADAVMPGGESLRQVQERAQYALDRIVAAHEGSTVAAVAHNFVILTLLCKTLDLPLAQFRRLRQDLAGFSIIEAGDRPVVASMNDGAHLVALKIPG